MAEDGKVVEVVWANFVGEPAVSALGRSYIQLEKRCFFVTPLPEATSQPHQHYVDRNGTLFSSDYETWVGPHGLVAWQRKSGPERPCTCPVEEQDAARAQIQAACDLARQQNGHHKQ